MDHTVARLCGTWVSIAGNVYLVRRPIRRATSAEAARLPSALEGGKGLCFLA